jgi:hypothetical protein
LRRVSSFLLVGATAAILAPFASAHFRLLEPQSWLVENELGDPQKLGPCGGTTANPGMPSNIVNKVQGGRMLHIKVQETVFHPGHYRVALAVNSRAELPPDPAANTRDSERGPWSVSAPIQNLRKFPSSPTACSRIPPGKPIHGRLTSRSPTSIAITAPCRSPSSWPNTVSIRTAATTTIIAPICRSRRILPSRSTHAGRPTNRDPFTPPASSQNRPAA